MGRQLAGGFVAVLLAASACGAESVRPTEGLPDKQASAGVGFELLTHCGIRETRFDGQFWKADPPLDDGSGNPPPGWDNPMQRGTMRRLSPTTAEFRDRAGHVVKFTLRARATDFLSMCA